MEIDFFIIDKPLLKSDFPQLCSYNFIIQFNCKVKFLNLLNL